MRTVRRPTAAVALRIAVASGLFLSPVWADDWPVYLGPRQDNTSEEEGLLTTWPEGGPPRVWSKTLGASFAPPVVAKGRLVAFHRLGDEEVVECVDALTGKSLWKARYPTHYVDRYGYNGGPRCSPAIDGDFVYTYGAEGVLTCLALATGVQVWQRTLNADLHAPQEYFGVGGSPVVDGDKVFVNPGGTDGAGVVGVNKKTGKIAWKVSQHGASYSRPIVHTLRGQRVVIFFTKAGLLAVRSDTGEILHEFPFRSANKYSVNGASPVVVDDVVFLSAAYKVGSIKLRLTPEGPKALWRDKRSMQNHWSTSIHHAGYLYGTHGRHAQGAVLRCLDWKTQQVRWTSPKGLARTTFLMVEGHFLVLGERGLLARVAVDPDRYVEKQRVKVLEGPCWTPPVLANGLLYLRNETLLLCLDLRAEKAAAKPRSD